MKILEIENTDEEDYGQYASIEIRINGIKGFRIGGGEPEDMNLCRDLNDAYSVVGLMKEAFDAGVAGEIWEHDKIVAKSWDDLESKLENKKEIK